MDQYNMAVEVVPMLLKALKAHLDLIARCPIPVETFENKMLRKGQEN